eukprot:scaffold18969_cov205-Skeletonema_dohrnii-CCMP3373.AAC.1
MKVETSSEKLGETLEVFESFPPNKSEKDSTRSVNPRFPWLHSMLQFWRERSGSCHCHTINHYLQYQIDSSAGHLLKQQSIITSRDMEEKYTVQLSFQEGRKLGLVLIDGPPPLEQEIERSNDDSQVHTSSDGINGAVRSVASAISAAATTVVAAAQSVTSPARAIRVNNKRKREMKVCISPNSIVFTFVAKLIETAKAHDIDETDFDKLMEWARTKSLINTEYAGTTYSSASFNEQSLLYALTGTIKPMDEVEKIQYRKTGLEKNTQNKPRQIGERRSQPYFRSDHYKTFFCCNANLIQDVVNILLNPENYPLYITLKRRPAIKRTDPINIGDSSLEPPRKRQRTNNDTQQLQQQQQSNDGVICLLDSSDEEEDSNVSQTTEANSNDKNDIIDESFSMMSIEPQECTVPKDPPTLQFEEDDFVLTPYGAGKILTSRIERRALVTNNDATIFKPIRIYSIDLHFGTCHLPATQIQSLTGTWYDKTIYTYQKVPLNEHDLLRLRPMTYLNDSIVNFYLKYVKCQVEAATASTGGAAKSEGGSWDDFDGEEILTCSSFQPSYCYTRIQSSLNGNRNSKANRDRIWKDLKSWTKNVDIFKKRLLVFPINDSLHWTVCIVCNPGRLIRRYSKEVIEKKQNLELKQQQAVEERKRERRVRLEELDASSPLANQTGVAPLSLTPILDGSGCVQPESGHDVVGVDDKPETIQSIEQAKPTEQSTLVTDTPAARKCILLAKIEAAANKKKEVQWMCEYCGEAGPRYETFDLALEHESTCDENIDWCMIHFDSGKHFKLHKSTEVLGNIRKYLNAAAADYESTHPGVIFTTKNMPGFSAAVPQQDNAKDCGVYMLEMAERMMRNTPQIDNEFVKKKGASKNNFFGSNSFNKDVIVQKRDDIHQLIQRLRRGETSL